MEVTLSTGVVLRLKRPNGWAMTAVLKKMEGLEPKPPKVYIEAKGRDEENPDDPGYLAAVKMYEAELLELFYNALALTGTEVVSVPEGIDGPTGEGWRALLTSLDLEVEQDAGKQYLQWLKFMAAPDPEDWLTKIVQPLLEFVGTKEAAVAEAIDTFRSVPERGADPEPVSVGSNSNGTGILAADSGVGATL